MAQALSCWPLTAEVQVRFPANPSDICGGQRGTGTDFFPPEYFGPSLSISFHQRFSLFVYELIFSGHGRSLGTFEKLFSFSSRGELVIKVLSLFLFSRERVQQEKQQSTDTKVGMPCDYKIELSEC